jgi:hypothetical protein
MGMSNKKYLLLLAALVVAGVVVGCIGFGGSGVGGDNNNGDTLYLTIDRWDNSGAAVLNLNGPDEPSLRTVTYFVFGSDTNLGDAGIVPLQPHRLDEQQFGPLVYGDKLENVDLSPWNQYNFVYFRSIGAQPNKAFRLDAGITYDVRPS